MNRLKRVIVGAEHVCAAAEQMGKSGHMGSAIPTLRSELELPEFPGNCPSQLRASAHRELNLLRDAQKSAGGSEQFGAESAKSDPAVETCCRKSTDADPGPKDSAQLPYQLGRSSELRSLTADPEHDFGAVTYL